MKTRLSLTLAIGIALGIFGTVAFVRYKTGTSFKSTVDITNELAQENSEWLADYSLSELKCAAILRTLEEDGEASARTALWGASKRIYWNQVNNVERSPKEVEYGKSFVEFVDSTPSLARLVEANPELEVE